jgi:hypothetical protein
MLNLYLLCWAQLLSGSKCRGLCASRAMCQVVLAVADTIVHELHEPLNASEQLPAACLFRTKPTPFVYLFKSQNYSILTGGQSGCSRKQQWARGWQAWSPSPRHSGLMWSIWRQNAANKIFAARSINPRSKVIQGPSVFLGIKYKLSAVLSCFSSLGILCFVMNSRSPTCINVDALQSEIKEGHCQHRLHGFSVQLWTCFTFFGSPLGW